MKYIFIMVIRLCIAFLIIILILNSSVYSQNNTQFIDKVDIGESCTRYYLHFDKNGNSPDGLGVDRLKGNIKAGDEIVVRFYPNSIFKIDSEKITLNEPGKKESCVFIFPKGDIGGDKIDTFSIQRGYTDFYFATKDYGNFLLRIDKQPSDLKVGDTIKAKTNPDLYKELIKIPEKESSKRDNILTNQLQKLKGFDKWTVRKFENQFLDKGIYTVEIYYYSPVTAVLVNRIKALQVDDIFQNTHLTVKNDMSNTSDIVMEKVSSKGFFEGTIQPSQVVAGIVSLNIIYEFLKGSWYYRQAPTAFTNRRLFYNDQNIPVIKAIELPNSIRIRAGFGVLNSLSEIRLISNFVLVMNPKNYFSSSTPFCQRFNPTLGLQVGATGDKDLVVLMGLSFKLINEGDLVLGFRFNGDGNKWQIGKNFYFGITLDPGLFGQLKDSQ